MFINCYVCYTTPMCIRQKQRACPNVRMSYNCHCVSGRGLLLTVGSPLLHITRQPYYFWGAIFLSAAIAVFLYLVVALRATRPPVAGRNREAGRGFTRFKEGARNAPLEASIAMQDAAKAAADDLMLISKSSIYATRVRL